MTIEAERKKVGMEQNDGELEMASQKMAVYRNANIFHILLLHTFEYEQKFHVGTLIVWEFWAQGDILQLQPNLCIRRI